MFSWATYRAEPSSTTCGGAMARGRSQSQRKDGRGAYSERDTHDVVEGLVPAVRESVDTHLADPWMALRLASATGLRYQSRVPSQVREGTHTAPRPYTYSPTRA